MTSKKLPRLTDLKGLADQMIWVAKMNPCLETEDVIIDTGVFTRRIPEWGASVKLCYERHRYDGAAGMFYHLSIFCKDFTILTEERLGNIVEAFFGQGAVSKIDQDGTTDAISRVDTPRAIHLISRRVVKSPSTFRKAEP